MKTNGTEAFATIKLPADIGKRRLATLRCKVDTGAGGNVMPLRAFSKLFPERFNTDGHPTGLTPSTTRLSAYNGSTIKQYGTFDTHIDWTPKGTKTSTPCKTAACAPVRTPAPPTGVAQQQTGAAPAAPRRSARATKPNKRLIEEM